MLRVLLANEGSSDTWAVLKSVECTQTVWACIERATMRVSGRSPGAIGACEELQAGLSV